MMANSISSDESSLSDIEISCGNIECITDDLSIDDFNDEDLSEITEEKSLRRSCINGRYKKKKNKLSRSQISEHMKKISPDMIQLDLDENFNSDVTTKYGTKCNGYSQQMRPQTLKLFSEHDDEPMNEKRKGKKYEEGSKPSKNKRDHKKSTKSSKGEKDEEPSRVNRTRKREQEIQDQFLTRSASEWSIDDPDGVEYCYLNGEIKRQTHVAAFTFVPRHSDELRLEIYDPIHVEVQADDLWCEGLNMRTGKSGIFPSYYGQHVLNYVDETSAFDDDCWEKFFLYFIGSVEVPCHKGNDVLCQAMYKIAEARRETLHCSPPAYVCLMLGTRGVKMIDQSELKNYKSKSKNSRSHRRTFSSSSKVKQQTHFFQLKNVSFCGHHPRNEKYFGFITRHPTEYRFACHTFISDQSTRSIIECFGNAFAQYFQDYMDYVQPDDDMYLE